MSLCSGPVGVVGIGVVWRREVVVVLLEVEWVAVTERSLLLRGPRPVHVFRGVDIAWRMQVNFECHVVS